MNERTRYTAIQGLADNIRLRAIDGIAMDKCAQSVTGYVSPSTYPLPVKQTPIPKANTLEERKNASKMLRQRNALPQNYAPQKSDTWEWMKGAIGGEATIDNNGNVNRNWLGNAWNQVSNFGKNIYTGTANMGAGIINGAASIPGLAVGLVAGAGSLAKGTIKAMTDGNYSWRDNIADSLKTMGNTSEWVDQHTGMEWVKDKMEQTRADLNAGYYKRNMIDPNNKSWADSAGTFGLEVANMAGNGIGSSPLGRLGGSRAASLATRGVGRVGGTITTAGTLGMASAANRATTDHMGERLNNFGARKAPAEYNVDFDYSDYYDK